jgi:hypothetical protein
MFSRDARDITSLDGSGLEPSEKFDHDLLSFSRGVIVREGASRHDEPVNGRILREDYGDILS